MAGTSQNFDDSNQPILEVLSLKPDLSAKEIAKEIRQTGVQVDRSTVNRRLYRLLKSGQVRKSTDSVPKWSLSESVSERCEEKIVSELGDGDGLPQFLSDLGID